MGSLSMDAAVRILTALAAAVGIATSVITLSKTSRLKNAVEKELSILQGLKPDSLAATSLRTSIDAQVVEISARNKYPPPIGYITTTLTFIVGFSAWFLYVSYDDYPRASFYFTGIGAVWLLVFFGLMHDVNSRLNRWHYAVDLGVGRKRAHEYALAAANALDRAALVGFALIAFVPWTRTQVDLDDTFSGSAWGEFAFAAIAAVPILVATGLTWRRVVRTFSWSLERKRAKVKIELAHDAIRALDQALLDPGQDRDQIFAAKLDLELKLIKAERFAKRLRKQPWARTPPGWANWPLAASGHSMGQRFRRASSDYRELREATRRVTTASHD